MSNRESRAHAALAHGSVAFQYVQAQVANQMAAFNSALAATSGSGVSGRAQPSENRSAPARNATLRTNR